MLLIWNCVTIYIGKRGSVLVHNHNLIGRRLKLISGLFTHTIPAGLRILSYHLMSRQYFVESVSNIGLHAPNKGLRDDICPQSEGRKALSPTRKKIELWLDDIFTQSHWSAQVQIRIRIRKSCGDKRASARLQYIGKRRSVFKS